MCSIILVREGFLQEEIAASLCGGDVTIRSFPDQAPTIEQILEENADKRVIRIVSMHPKYISDEHPLATSYRDANTMVAEELDSDWKCFRDYEREGSDAYHACQSIKLLPCLQRLAVIRRCIEDGGKEVFQSHVSRGTTLIEKGKVYARIAAEHSLFFPGKGYALTSLGSACEINFTHAALRERYPSARLTIVHYYRTNPEVENALLQKWSVRGAVEDEELVTMFMSSICNEGKFGGSVGGMVGVPGGAGWYQAGGTGKRSFDELCGALDLGL